MLYRTGLLVVDDFDKDIDSAWAQRQLYQVVSRRYGLRLPTVWTANTQIDQFRRACGLSPTRPRGVDLAANHGSGLSHPGRWLMYADRLPPHDANAEESVMGSVPD